MPVPSRKPFQVGTFKYQILDRHLAETTTADVPYAVITITGNEQDFIRVPESPNRVGVLKIKFDDIQNNIDGMTLFNALHARQIIDFVSEMRAAGAQQFVVNCEQGRCRSAAVAAAIAEINGGRTGWFDRRFSPNAHVKRVLLEEAGRRAAMDVDSKSQEAQSP